MGVIRLIVVMFILGLMSVSWLRAIMVSGIILSLYLPSVAMLVIVLGAVNPKCHYTEWHYAERH
jgi:hypothetical protein